MKNLLALMVLIPIFLSCTTYHKTVRGLTEEGIKDTEISMEIARNLLKTWPHRSGIITGYLQEDKNKYQIECLSIIKKLDDLAEKEDLTDRELGEARGMFIKLVYLAGEKIIELIRIRI